MKETSVFLAVVAIIAAIFAALSWLFEFLWNLVLVPLFNAPHLTFWYAAGLIGPLMIVGSFFRSSSSKK